MTKTERFDYAPFDTLLESDGPVMLVGRQLLKPASLDAAVEIVFPPSYANPSERKDDPPVYNIDALDPADPSKNVCVLDSVPSQANRMEPLFGSKKYSTLVPQYSIRFLEGEPPVSILGIGHRIADASFRGTPLRDAIEDAFKSYAKSNAFPMAKIGPTSLLFGAWDSRGTGIKVPRLISSIIRAFNVVQLKRSAQYSPPIKYEQEGLIPAGLDGKPSDHGLADVPSTHKIGGIHINGEIRRDFALNISALRALKGKDEEETKNLQRYILSLALLAFTATPEPTLRQGCQLLPKSNPIWKRFFASGDEVDWSPDEPGFADFATAAANDFGVVQPDNQPLVFDKKRLKASIDAGTNAKADKKAKNVENPVDTLLELIEKLTSSGAGTKLNSAPVKKLTKHLESIPSGSDLKSCADQMLVVLKGEESSESIIQNLKILLPNETGVSIDTNSNKTDSGGERV